MCLTTFSVLHQSVLKVIYGVPYVFYVIAFSTIENTSRSSFKSRLMNLFLKWLFCMLNGSASPSFQFRLIYYIPQQQNKKPSHSQYNNKHKLSHISEGLENQAINEDICLRLSGIPKETWWKTNTKTTGKYLCKKKPSNTILLV